MHAGSPDLLDTIVAAFGHQNHREILVDASPPRTPMNIRYGKTVVHEYTFYGVYYYFDIGSRLLSPQRVRILWVLLEVLIHT